MDTVINDSWTNEIETKLLEIKEIMILNIAGHEIVEKKIRRTSISFFQLIRIASIFFMFVTSTALFLFSSQKWSSVFAFVGLIVNVIMLSLYMRAGWGKYCVIHIKLGHHVQRLAISINNVLEIPKAHRNINGLEFYTKINKEFNDILNNKFGKISDELMVNIAKKLKAKSKKD